MDYIKYIRGMVGNNKIILNAAGGIVEKDGMILLQHRADNGWWGLPGGMMEIGEDLKETAIREIKEETGLDVEIEKLVGVYHNKNMSYPNGDKSHVIVTCFLFKVVGGELKKDHESLELKFFKPEELPYLEAIDHREAIADYLAGRFNNVH